MPSWSERRALKREKKRAQKAGRKARRRAQWQAIRQGVIAPVMVVRLLRAVEPAQPGMRAALQSAALCGGILSILSGVGLVGSVVNGHWIAAAGTVPAVAIGLTIALTALLKLRG